MAIDFPTSPTNGQVFTSGDKTWAYSTSVGAWQLQAQTITGATGAAGADGADGVDGINGINGATPALEHIAGRHYGPTLGGGMFLLANIPTNTNVIHFVPIFITKFEETLTQIGFRTGSTFTGTAVYRIGLYSNVNGSPLNRIDDYGTVSATASSSYYEVTTSRVLQTGWYWIAIGCVSSTNSPTIQATAQSTVGYGFQSLLGTTNRSDIFSVQGAHLTYFTTVASLTAMPNPIATSLSYSYYAILAYFFSS